jgi:hypothetical protein
MTRPLPWSHSSLEAVETCPRQYEEIKVLRNFQDKKNAASVWGDNFHKHAETYLNGGVLHFDIWAYKDYLDKFKSRKGKLLVEQQYALDSKLQPCEFLGENVWGRGIIDVLTLDGKVAWIDDHKTGKNRKKNLQQLIIFALLVFYHHPEIQTCHCAFHWTQHDFAQDKETFTRAQIPELWAFLLPKLKRYKGYFDMGVFPPKKSGLCGKFCAVTSCEYHGG